MRLQSHAALSVVLASASLFITSSVLRAQPSGGASNEPADPHPAASAAPSDIRSEAKPQNRLPLDELNGVLEKYRNSGNRQAEGQTLGAIAGSYRSLHQQQKALELYQLALIIWRDIGDKDNEATTLAHIGDVYREWGFQEQAIHFYRDALKMYSPTTDKSELAAVFNNLGLAYFGLHDKKKCLEYLNQALTEYRAKQDRRGEASALINLGSAYAFLGDDPHKALDYFQQAVSKLELLNDHSSEANALEVMGLVWLKLQNKDMAVQSFQRALFLFGRTGNTQGEASVRKQLRAVGETETIASAR
jgi:tetratricopeptide (TPR) repeat protein